MGECEFGHLAELGSGHDQRRAAAALPPTDARIKVSPDQVASFGRYVLADPLKGMTPEAMREAFGWGPDKGRERALSETRARQITVWIDMDQRLVHVH